MKSVEDVYPLSPLQESLLLNVLSSPGSRVGLEQKCYTLSGELDEDAFARTWQTVVERNPILRTSFFMEGLERPLQVVHRRVTLPLERHDWRTLAEEERSVRLEDLLERDQERGFDPSRAPLMRITLVRATSSSWYFVWTYHHLLLDAWCRTLVLREMFAFYDGFRQGNEPSLPRSRPYRDYIAWLGRQDLASAECFWRGYLEDAEALPPLRIDAPNLRSGRKRIYGSRQSEIPPPAMERLEALARGTCVTLGTLMQGAWAVLLERYSGRRDVLFGVTVSGRPAELPGVESMLGMFINNLPVRVRLLRGAKVADWLAQIQRSAAEMRRYEHVSPTQVQEWSGLPPGRRLFETLLLYQNTPTLGDVTEEMSSRRLTVSSYRFRLETSYPLTLTVAAGGSLHLWIYYEEERFDASAAARILGHFETLLAGMAEDPRRPIDDLPLLTLAEREQLLGGPADSCGDGVSPLLEDLVGTWARSTPDALAIRCGKKTVSYAELWGLSGELAQRLVLAAGPRVPGFACAVAFDPSLEGVITLLAVLRAGGAFEITERHGPEVLRALRFDVNLSELGVRPSGKGSRPVEAWHRAALVSLPIAEGTAEFTEVSHRALAASLAAAVARLDLNPGGQVSLSAPSAGHAAALACLLPWVAGACLTLRSDPGEEDSPRPAGGLVLHAAPPVTFQEAGVPVFCQDGPPGRGLLEARGEGAVYLAGVLEIGLWVAGGARTPGDPPTLGRPTIPGAPLLAVDADLRPVPTGIPGELCLGCEVLEVGFGNRPDLTAERLVPHSSSARPGARMLRTGVLVRGTPDGGLEPLGLLRHRPSGLGEVEAVLRRHPRVLDWTVRVWEPATGGTALAVFVVPSRSYPELRDELSCLLSRVAPRSLADLKVVVVPKLPRNAHGELDLTSLPDPREVEVEGRSLPRSPVEDVLAGIWAALLGVERVGVEDNLLDLGVHSLLATQLVSRVRQVFQVDLPLRSLFELPTVAGQALRIERSLQAGQSLVEAEIVPVPRAGDLPLSYAQERLWFVHQVDPASSAFNIPRAVRILGSLALSSLAQALGALATRHESLRTRFPARDGSAVQEISPRPDLQPAIVDLSALQQGRGEAEARRLAAEEAKRPFNLSTGPLVRASLMQMGPGDHLAVFVLHHIVADAWSMGVLVRELAVLYEAFQAGATPDLPSLPVQYADFAHWQRRWLEAGGLESQLAYWTERLRGAPEGPSLATDFPRRETQTFRGAFHPFSLTPELSRAVHRLGREEGVTVFMVLLAGFSLLLSRYTGQEDIVVGTDIANRNRLELEGIIGFFVNNLVLRTDLSGNPTFRELLRRVREVTLGAYAHQDLPFDRLVKELRPRRSLSRTPLFQVLFVLQNAPAPPLRFSGLELRSMEIDFGMSKFDLALFMTERPGGLVGSWHYSTDLFRAETIARATTHFVSLLKGAAASPDTRLSEISMLTPEELELREQVRREREESALGRLKGIRGRRAAQQTTEPTGAAEILPV